MRFKMQIVKKLSVFIIAALVLMGCSNVAEESTLEKTTFWASLDCEKCKTKIFNNIPFEEGVEDLAVDVPKQEVTIVYNKTETDKNKLIKALENLGYEAKEIKE